MRPKISSLFSGAQAVSACAFGGFLLAAVLASLTARGNDIEPGKEFYTATIAGGPITIDGNLKEWAGVPVLADPKFSIPKGSGTGGKLVLFEEYNGGTWTGPDDQTSAVQVVYDVDNVYFGFVVTDDYHENAANSAWNGDSIQLMIANADRNQQIALYNYALGGVEGALGDVIVQHEAGPGGAADCNCATEAVITRDATTKKTIYEIKLPAGALGLTAPLKAGTKFGLGMAINDGDEATPGQKGWGGLGAHSIVFGKTPGETALITLGTEKPGVDRIFFSAINPTIDSFSFRATDKATSIVDPASAKLTIDGENITITSKKTGDATDFSFKRSSPFASGADHTYSILVKDTQGNSVTSDGTFKTPAYVTLAADSAAPAGTVDKTKPGFKGRLHQVSTGQANSNERTEQQLAGELGDNQVSPDSFVETGVLDYVDSGATGNFDTGAALPNGVTGDNIAMEVLTFIDFPAAGLYTMGVNSDDGFRVTSGKDFRDRLDKGAILGEFSGGRGVTDTTFQFFVGTPGIYPFRLTWEEGGGDAAVEWFSVLPNGAKALVNDPATTSALKAYSQGPVRGPAYIKQVRPGVGVTLASNDPAGKKIEIQLEDADTQVVQGSVKMKFDGASVTPTATKAGTTTTVTVSPATVGAGSHTVELSYDHSTTPVSTRTVSFSYELKLTPADLPANSFWIEAEDFDFDGGKTMDVASTMPYLGGAYDTLGAVEGVDYNNDDANDSDQYRTETDANGENEVNITGNLGGRWGTERPGGVSMTANYRIGWVGSGNWQDYTRTIPNGIYRVYAALSYDGTTASLLRGSLDKVTAGVGTANQTLQRLGTFDAPGSGGWGANDIVPMKSASGDLAAVKLSGKTTLRFNMESGDFDYFVLSPATGVPPKVSSASPGINEKVSGSSKVAVELEDLSTAVVTSSVKVLFDGTDVTPQATVSKTGEITKVGYTPPSPLVAGSDHSYKITFSDNGTPVTTQDLVVNFNVTVLPSDFPANSFWIEAEDFNYDGGKTKAAASQMPYLGGAYDGLGAVKGVDYINADGNDSDVYRTEKDDNGENEVNITDNLGGRLGKDRPGGVTMTANYRIGWVALGEWQNYTRTFPDGDYKVYAALSYDGTSPGLLQGSLDLVTTAVDVANQTVTALGSFNGAGSGGWGQNDLVPMVTTSGTPAVVHLGGTQTVRFNLNSGDFDYLLFWPQASTGPKFTKVSVNGANLVIEWTGSGTLVGADVVTGPYTPVTGNPTSPASIPIAGAARFFGIKQ